MRKKLLYILKSGAGDDSSHEMSFAEQVAALRAFFGAPESVPLPLAIEEMNMCMGIRAAGPLPVHIYIWSAG